MTDIFAAIDIATVAVTVTTLAVAGIGVRMAFKAWVLGKEGVRKI